MRWCSGVEQRDHLAATLSRRDASRQCQPRAARITWYLQTITPAESHSPLNAGQGGICIFGLNRLTDSDQPLRFHRRFKHETLTLRGTPKGPAELIFGVSKLMLHESATESRQGSQVCPKETMFASSMHFHLMVAAVSRGGSALLMRCSACRATSSASHSRRGPS